MGTPSRLKLRRRRRRRKFSQPWSSSKLKQSSWTRLKSPPLTLPWKCKHATFGGADATFGGAEHHLSHQTFNLLHAFLDCRPFQSRLLSYGLSCLSFPSFPT